MQSKCSKRGYFSNRSSNIEPHNKACTHNKACFHSVKVAVMSHQSPLCSRFTTAIDLSSVLHVESLLSVSIPPAASDRPLGQRRTFAGKRRTQATGGTNQHEWKCVYQIQWLQTLTACTTTSSEVL